ncbi:MAG: 16S rRNA (cytosine(1402)-N(4))-methyltransferase RsmH [Spirosomataceae bacterium]
MKTDLSTSPYHIPVMLNECMQGLNIKKDGVYVDVTFGGGGHSRAILDRLENGRLIAFDQDQDARENAEALKSDSRFLFIQANFSFLERYLKVYNIGAVDGILADLGVSSHQIDDPSRGFSTRFDGPLDMRMNTNDGEQSAWEVVNNYSAEALQSIFSRYGEVHNSRTLANAIFTTRHNAPINTVGELVAILKRFAPKYREYKYYAQVFQAIRIEVNRELEALENFLTQTPKLLKPGGRLVVMSYHSLEDRLVKNFMLKGNFKGEPEKDFYGRVIKPLQAITKKPIEADGEEVLRNPRARSAKLRIAEKILEE